MSVGALDPLLAPALQMEQRPIIPVRTWADGAAGKLATVMEEISQHITTESDPRSCGQLMNVMEALGVISISLVAYSRGVVPQVGSRKPHVNIITG